MRKRSVTIDGHRTSISLEDAFWAELSEIARARSLSLNALVAEIDHARSAPQSGNTGSNLSSVLRLYVLDDLKKRTISRA
ncbi:MAG: aryl-sulfate sulfotransferase [Alphaproteobacteria bacterium RIFCSPHIGHO2_12_FULL_66_14]|jgi:predicted DNA-binding ribbon-helix-helix protein|nr:MAG: aryl-sulfate sulfotransferase [Alphaproteobacteria bacterium RIFCSPHIGHO2_12_FULL_66_14]